MIKYSKKHILVSEGGDIVTFLNGFKLDIGDPFDTRLLITDPPTCSIPTRNKVQMRIDRMREKELEELLEYIDSNKKRAAE